MVLSRCTVETAVNKAISKLGFSSLKPQQMMAINEFINGRVVFVVLPTAFGFCFTCPPINPWHLMSYIPTVNSYR